MKIIKEWLKKEGACSKGYKWFTENYPDGLEITKKNIGDLYSKLMKRTEGFEGTTSSYFFCNNKKFDSVRTLGWILASLDFGFNMVRSSIYREDWHEGTKKEIIDAWWKDYKGIIK